MNAPNATVDGKGRELKRNKQTMKNQEYFYRCSQEYISSISSVIYDEVISVVNALPKRQTQAELNKDFFWLFLNSGWTYDSKPQGLLNVPPEELRITSVKLPFSNKNRGLCLSSTTLDAKWHTDFAKQFEAKLVQVEVQFGTVESRFKDFCGFRIATYEGRLALGVEIVLDNPNKYFSHRRSAISGMAYFDVAKRTLPAIGLDCPIWLIGID
jgi:hypothetical protein